MTTENINCTNFNFRTKFKKCLNDENSRLITSVFEKFCNLVPVEARNTLWRMTFSVDSALAELYRLGMASEKTLSENILLFRNELRFQYEQINPNFLKPSMDVHIGSAFLELESKSDIIVANIVFEHCQAAISKRQYLDRTLFLLKSEKDNHYFGGIRSLEFNMEESEYLKPFHIEIHNLLAAMQNFFENDLPFYSAEEERREKNAFCEKQVENFAVDPVETVEEFNAITPERILEHMEVFKAFIDNDDFNLLLPIAQLSFDLNEVMMKKEEIFNFIRAVEDLVSYK